MLTDNEKTHSFMHVEIAEVDLENKEEEDDLQSKLSSLCKSRNSLTLHDFGVYEKKKTENRIKITDYEIKLEKEINQWTELLKNTKERMKRTKNNKIEFGQEILSAAHFQYINSAPDLEKFAEESKKFCTKCKLFLASYEEALNLKENLMKEGKNIIAKDILINGFLEL